jgi:hypothetical protein
MSYLNPLKNNEGVDIAYLKGFELSNIQGILEANGRSMVKSVTNTHVSELDENMLNEILQEALFLNETHYK